MSQLWYNLQIKVAKNITQTIVTFNRNIRKDSNKIDFDRYVI